MLTLQKTNKEEPLLKTSKAETKSFAISILFTLFFHFKKTNNRINKENSQEYKELEKEARKDLSVNESRNRPAWS